MLHTFYNIRKTLDSSGFPVILPNPNRITPDEAPDESQALLFYTRQAELARAQTRYGTTTKARSARCASSVDDGPRRKGKRSAAT